MDYMPYICCINDSKLMKITEVHLVTFSPTHTSKQIGEAIVCGIGCDKSVWTDLTQPVINPISISRNALTVIVVPVYGGHVAPLAAQRLVNVTSEGGPAVIVVVYGNRAYEKALVDLDALATHNGFKVIAGGTFIGEHSYCSDRYPIACGRPDSADLEYADLFGQKIRTKMMQAVDESHLYGVDVTKIQRPTQSFFGLLRFFFQLKKLRKSGAPFPRTPKVDASACTHCGLCVSRCPNEAIVKGDECNTLADKCIKCCACVKACPVGARSFDTPFAPLLSRYFQRPKQNRIIL